MFSAHLFPSPLDLSPAPTPDENVFADGDAAGIVVGIEVGIEVIVGVDVVVIDGDGGTFSSSSRDGPLSSVLSRRRSSLHSAMERGCSSVCLNLRA